MKYQEMFTDAVDFTDGTYVIGGWYSQKEAAERMSHDIGEDVEPEDLKEGRVRFGFPSEFVDDCDPKDGPIWHSGATGKGSKPVWVFKY